MTEIKTKESDPQSDRATWETPELRRIDAIAAEAVIGSLGDDGVFNIS